MDFMTLGGWVLGFSVVYFIMWESHLLHFLFNVEAFVFIGGGTIASLMISYPWSALQWIPTALKIMVVKPKRVEPTLIIRQICKLSAEANRNGVEDINIGEPPVHPFLGDALQMLSEGLDAEAVHERLMRDILLTQQRQALVTGVFKSAGNYAPLFGLAGTLVGIVRVMQNISDASTMAKAMGTAMVASFYGVLTANLICLPIATKLAYLTEEDLLAKEIIARGVLAIQKGEPPYMVFKRLEGYLSYALRRREQQRMTQTAGAR